MSSGSLHASDLQAAITETFHLINTVRVSTELLTRDVRKVVAAGANDNVLEALYEMPEFASGQNLRAFTAQTSQQHEHALASLWLFVIIGHYEVWADELPFEDSADGCQFPTLGYSSLSVSKKGFGDVFGHLVASPAMQTTFGSSVVSDAKVLVNRTDDAIATYRLYKECRNSLAHAGGRASTRVVNWGTEASARASDLHVDGSGSPTPMPICTEGSQIELTIGQVRSLVAVLLRLAQTIDSAILLSEDGDSLFRERWQVTHGPKPLKVERRKIERGRWITARCQEALVPVPDNPLDLRQYLVDCSLVKELN